MYSSIIEFNYFSIAIIAAAIGLLGLTIVTDLMVIKAIKRYLSDNK